MAAPTVNWMTNLGIDPTGAQRQRPRDRSRRREHQTPREPRTRRSTRTARPRRASATCSASRRNCPSWLDPENVVGAASSTTFKGAARRTRSRPTDRDGHGARHRGAAQWRPGARGRSRNRHQRRPPDHRADRGRAAVLHHALDNSCSRPQRRPAADSLLRARADQGQPASRAGYCASSTRSSECACVAGN